MTSGVDPTSSRSVLEGVRVLELADWIAGPFASSILSDFGAEVVRIDLPGKVANTRTLHGMEEEVDSERSPFFAIFAHDKLSVTLDVRSDAGREVFLDLVAKSDVIIEGFRPGTMERWGIGWEELHRINPSLVMLRISGYGQTGPWRERPGLDRVAQAFAGVSFLTGQPTSPPVRCGVGFADYSTGLWGALGVMLALFECRCNGGVGQMIDHALYESILPMLCEVPLQFQRYGRVGTRTGNQFHGIAPGDAFETSDGAWVQISASGDVAWRRLTAAMQRPDLEEDPRFATSSSRDENNDVLLPIIAEWVRPMTADELVEGLEVVGVAAAKMQRVDEVMRHPQVVARGNFLDLDDPKFGALPAYAPMPRLSATPGSISRPGPMLGEHNDVIFQGLLGYDDLRMTTLAEVGAI